MSQFPRDCPFSAVSTLPSISADGRYVAFSSVAVNFAPGDTNATVINDGSDIFVRDRKTGQTKRVSVSSSGEQARYPDANSSGARDSQGSTLPSISADGRYVTFWSSADNLVPDDTNEMSDFFRHDTKTGRTVRVSLTSGGKEAPFGQGSHDLARPSISRNGRYVMFSSRAPLGEERHPNSGSDHYVRDLKKNTTEIVSVSSDGSPGWNSINSFDISENSISADGRYVTFQSSAPDLVPNDTNECLEAGSFLHLAVGVCGDVFVHDRKSGRTERISISSDGSAQGEAPSLYPGISRDGRFVTYTSIGSNIGSEEEDTIEECGLNGFLLPWNPGCDMDIFLYDRKTGANEWISKSSDGRDAQCALPKLDAHACASRFSTTVDGRFVTFISRATNFASGDSNDAEDVFLVDRGLPLSVGELVDSGQAPRMSLDGVRSFARTGTAWIEDAVSDAQTSKLGTAGELLGARITYRPLLEDIFIVLELEHMPRTPALAAVTAGSVYGMAFTLDGSPYEIRAASTGLGFNGETAATFGLFSCPSDNLLCTKVADLKGGFGTTGERIVFSVPLHDLGIRDGSVIEDAKAFTSLGTLLGGPSQVLDEATLQK